MVTELFDLFARAMPVVLGGGAVQLIMHFLKRRQEMRAADVAADKQSVEGDAVVVASAEKSLLLSDQVRDRAVRRAEQLLVDLQLAESELATLSMEARELRLMLHIREREVGILQAKLTLPQEREEHP